MATLIVQALRMYQPRKQVAMMLDANPLLRKRNQTKWEMAHTFVSAARTVEDIRSTVELRNSVAKARRNSVTTVGTAAELDAIPFWQQGDDSLNTEAVLAVRAKIRRHPDVVEQLQRWWVTAQSSMRETHGDAYPAHVLARDEYIRISRLLSKALLAEYDAPEAQRCAEEDFATDSGGLETMTREQFMDGVYELADVYTRTVKVEEYVTFLKQLFDRVTKNAGGKHFWLAESAVKYGGYEDEDNSNSESGAVVAERADSKSQGKHARVGDHEEKSSMKSNEITSRRNKEGTSHACKGGRDGGSKQGNAAGSSEGSKAGRVSMDDAERAYVVVNVPVSKRAAFGSTLRIETNGRAMTVAQLTQNIAVALGVKTSELSLSLRSNPLSDGMSTLHDAGLRSGATVNAILQGDDGVRHRVGDGNEGSEGLQGGPLHEHEPIWLPTDGVIDHSADDAKLTMDWGSVDEKARERDGGGFHFGKAPAQIDVRTDLAPAIRQENTKGKGAGRGQIRSRDAVGQQLRESGEDRQVAAVKAEIESSFARRQRLRNLNGAVPGLPASSTSSIGQRWQKARSLVEKKDHWTPTMEALKSVLNTVMTESAAESMAAKLPTRKLEWVKEVVDVYGSAKAPPAVKLPKLSAAARASIHDSGAVTSREPRPPQHAPKRAQPRSARQARDLRTGGLHTTRTRRRASPSKVLVIERLPEIHPSKQTSAVPTIMKREAPPSRVGQGSFGFIM